MVWYELPKTVSPNGKSFHSMHATSQALQPMQVVVSISFATVYSRCVSCPGTGPEWPEIFCMRSASWLIGPLNLFHFHEKPLEFRRVRVRIDRRMRQLIHQLARGLAFVFRDAAIAPVEWNADLIDLFPINHHRLDAFGHHGFRNVLA